MPDVSIRAANECDCHGLEALYHSIFGSGGSTSYWQAQLSEPASLISLAQMPDGTVAGLLHARRVVDEAEIITVAVAHQCRRRGIAGRLLNELEAALHRDLPCRIFLEVSVENQAALVLYSGRGFVEVGRRRGYYNSPGRTPVDALVLQLDLARKQ